jgi:hypothetical protein
MGFIQPVLTVPAEGSLSVSVEMPGLVWYGWHGTRHGSEGRVIYVPPCKDGDEAILISNSDIFDREVKVFIEPESLRASVRGTDDSMTAIAHCDPLAIPIPKGR